DRLQRRLGQVLVRAVDRVAGLEPDDALPAPLGERGAGLGRVQGELREGRRLPLEHGDASGQVPRLLLVEARDARMLRVGRPEAALCLALLVVVEDALDLQDRDWPAGAV